MDKPQLTINEVADQSKALYEKSIRSQVETEENIGKMVVIEPLSGDFAVDAKGIESSFYLQERHPGARLFGIRIGYNVAASLGGVMERTAPR